MKKKYCLSVFLFIIIFITFIYKYNYNKDVSVDLEVNHKNEMISMMLETEAGSGKYEVTTSNVWPTEGYVFNSDLSGCENGGNLSWDDSNKTIIMSGNVSDKCYVYFDKKNPVLLNDYVMSLYTGTQGENGLYYHDSSLANGAEDNSYRYAGGDYVLTDAGKALGVTKIFSATADDTSGLIDFYCGTEKRFYGDHCSSTLTIYYLLKNDTTKYSSYYEVIEKAYENGYITGNVNNYVCFGSDERTCPVDNLYRIIGVFDNRVKLIKADYATTSLLGTDGDYKEKYSYIKFCYKGSILLSNIGGYMWNYNGLSDHTGDNETGSNTWSTSLLNKTNLNTNYLNNIGSKWSSLIDTTTWKVGGNTYFKIIKVIPSVAYQNEIINPDDNLTYVAKVGLMYVSDYGFAASPSSWTTELYDYRNLSISTENWMYMGLVEWSIMPRSDTLNYVYYVYNYGNVVNIDAINAFSVRPVIFLNTSVVYVNGSGTQSDPIRITD